MSLENYKINISQAGISAPLPPPQLRLLLEAAPDMREPLLEQVQGFNESQRQHVPATIMQVLYNVTQSDQQEAGKEDTPETEQTL